MRGVALSTLRTLLKAELKEAQLTNTALDAELNTMLASGQRQLADKWDWNFLKDRWDANAASRYVDIPTANLRGASSTINFTRPLLVERKWNTRWEKIEYGIGSEQYNHLDSDLGRQQDPIQCWQVDTNTGDATDPDEFEVWPIPVNAQTVRFTGQRSVRALAVDADKADLDDLLIVYFTAAEYLSQRRQENAGMVLKKFTDLLVSLRSGYPGVESPPLILGGNRSGRRENVKIIATAG